MAITKLPSNTRTALAITETTAGTYLDPTTADVKLYDVEPIALDATPVRTGNYASGTFKKGRYHTGVRRASTSFKANLISSGTPTVAPALKKFLEVAGGVEITDPTNVGYKWDGTPTCQTLSYKTILYECGAAPEGHQQAMRGATAGLSIAAANPGAPIILTFTLNGVSVAETDLASAAPIVPSGFDTAEEEKFIAAPFDLGGTVHKWTSFEFTTQAETNALQDGGNADGIDQTAITDTDLQLTASIRNTGIATTDWQGDQLADTIYGSLTVSLLNWDFTFTNLQIMEQALEDVDSFSSRTITFPVEEFKMVQK